MNLFRYIKYKRLLAKRRKNLAKFRSECPHSSMIPLGKKQWTKFSPLGASIQSSYSDTYEAEHFKCRRCGDIIRFNTVHLEHRSSKRQPEGKSVYIVETTDMITGKKNIKIS